MKHGESLGPYRILDKLGAGGMGEVYRAEDSRLHRTVAIKVLSRELATPDRVERFEQEARAASALNHPNILTIHDVGREGETAYIAMEWVEGRTLRQLLRDGPVPLKTTIRLAQQIAEGLAKAHAAGIVHRDLKPENVMVTDDGLAKIVDFGLAKLAAQVHAAAADQTPTVTRVGSTDPGMVMGTAGYMSPEQASGRPVDYRSDQFALGLLIYELVTRTRPFERPTTAQTLAATIEDDPAPLDAVNPDVPPHLGAIVSRCLAKDPAERYDSTRDLARDLKSITETSSRQTVAVAASAPLRTGLLAGLAIVVLLAAAAAAAWTWRAKSEPAAETASRPLLAVRPFRSLSDDAQQAYFAAGMTEEIRGQLSQVSSLRLLSRNGLDGYKDDAIRAVRELGVNNFVDGSVRVEANRVRVTAELVDGATQQTVWSQQYDRELADILAVQGDVAVQIARALQATLSPSEQQRLERRPTQNSEAYALYLQAQQLTPLTDRAKNFGGQELLRRALAMDPSFALARSRLAYRLVFLGYLDSPSYVDRGLAEAEAALRTDPGQPLAHFAIGTGYGIKGMDAQARQAFLRALELDPNNVPAMNNFSTLDALFGRIEESLYWGRRGFELSGKRGNDYYHVAVPLLYLRADDVLREFLLDGERREPNFYRIQILLAMLDTLQGNRQAAIDRTIALSKGPDANDEEVKFHSADVAFLMDAADLEATLEPLMLHSAENFSNVVESVRLRYAYALAKRGDPRAGGLLAEADKIARAKVDAGNESPALRVELAAAAAMRKDPEEAFTWLARAVDSGYRDYGAMEMDPILAPLKKDQRFAALLDRIRKDLEIQRTRSAERGLLNLHTLLRAAQLP